MVYNIHFINFPFIYGENDTFLALVWPVYTPKIIKKKYKIVILIPVKASTEKLLEMLLFG